MKMRPLCAALATICATLLSPAVQAQEPPPGTPNTGFAENTFITNTSLTLITHIAWAPDGSNRLFVARKGGEIRIIKNGALVPTPFATESPIFLNNECGLI